MNRNFLSFSLLIMTTLMSVAAVSAQQQNQMPDENAAVRRSRPNLLRELDLSPEQLQNIRRLNATRKRQMLTAQQRLRDARQNLDRAIYSDIADEPGVRARLTELQKAQAEVNRIRSMTEFEIRKILTPEQVTRFRRLRDDFAADREIVPNRRRERLNNRRRNVLRDGQPD